MSGMSDEGTRDAMTKSPEALAAKAEGLQEAASMIAGVTLSRREMVLELLTRAGALQTQAAVDNYSAYCAERNEALSTRVDDLRANIKERDKEIALLKQRLEDAESAIVTGQGPDAPYTAEEDEGITLDLTPRKKKKL